MAAEIGPLAQVRVQVSWNGYRPFVGLVRRRAGQVRRQACPARAHLSVSSYCTSSVTCEAGAPPAAATLPLLMSRSFHRCSSSTLAFGRRWSATTAKLRVFHTSSVMLLSVQTRFDCRTLLKGSIHNTSSILLYKVEKALPIDKNRGCGAILPRCEKLCVRQSE